MSSGSSSSSSSSVVLCVHSQAVLIFCEPNVVEAARNEELSKDPDVYESLNPKFDLANNVHSKTPV